MDHGQVGGASKQGHGEGDEMQFDDGLGDVDIVFHPDA